MVQYAYIPIANIAELANPNDYAVFNTAMRPVANTGLTDSNGDAIYLYEQIVGLEGNPEFTQAQKDDIVALGGQWFVDCEAYCAWFDSAINPS